ncbi:beta-lactamase family protein [Pseudoflavitalea sp. X16]|uniref:serine hydrolase domain-containing protein n=1 Tax=Paraflavitalea devenefica TaxID=2716334 RepID=UPI00141FF6D8|nr:serine hydrolase domain-containing protein [Paraflavitalea devenefica]NII29272.1 beta-lactamase family protein [Paraflavitalea devenefica]
MPLKIAFTSLFILWATVSYSQLNQTAGRKVATDNPLKSKLDSLVDKSVRTYFSNTSGVGLSIGMVKNGKTYFYNYGETANGNGVLPTNKTIYEIGSLTKTFTGILLAQAVLDKKIKLDDDIRKYLKEPYPNLEYNGTPIRVVDLSNHTARVTRIFLNFFMQAGYDSTNPYLHYSKEMLYQGFHAMKMDTLPGKKHSYSNMGVGLLGYILEDVYTQDYFTLISTFILRPIKMNDTKIDISHVRDLAKAHNAQKEVVPFWDMPSMPACGALRSNTADMIKYIYANNEDATKGIALSHKLTFGTDKDGLGLNWFILTTPEGYRVLNHRGSTGGSRSSFQCFPDQQAGFVLLTNSIANQYQLEKELASITTR